MYTDSCQQKTLQYCKVISIQLIKINGKINVYTHTHVQHRLLAIKNMKSTDRWIKKMWFYLHLYTYTYAYICIFIKYIMEYFSAIPKSEMLSFAGMWMNLENIMLREISQRKINVIWYHLTCGT